MDSNGDIRTDNRTYYVPDERRRAILNAMKVRRCPVSLLAVLADIPRATLTRRLRSFDDRRNYLRTRDEQPSQSLFLYDDEINRVCEALRINRRWVDRAEQEAFCGRGGSLMVFARSVTDFANRFRHFAERLPASSRFNRCYRQAQAWLNRNPDCA